MHTLTLTSNYVPEAVHLSRADHLATLATQALIAEAELTPKPGLVDRRGAGAHDDLSLNLLRRSAIVLKPYFSAMAYFGAGRDASSALRQELAMIGRDAERAMYKATCGSNAHKGAVWILGLLVAAAAQRAGQSAKEITAAAGAIARLPDRPQPPAITHGDLVRIRYGAAGARGEASNNFPHVIGVGLPTLRRQRVSGLSEQICRLNVLLSIMFQLDDTCVLYRGGLEALNAVKSGAQAVLTAGGYGTVQGQQQMCELDRQLIARHISPGGSADLLAATIFLDAVERRQSEIRNDHDQSREEGSDGAA
jgi:triphosphoribosyl-dephospho-CoA synthase